MTIYGYSLNNPPPRTNGPLQLLLRSLSGQPDNPVGISLTRDTDFTKINLLKNYVKKNQRVFQRVFLALRVKTSAKNCEHIKFLVQKAEIFQNMPPFNISTDMVGVDFSSSRFVLTFPISAPTSKGKKYKNIRDNSGKILITVFCSIQFFKCLCTYFYL